MVLWEITAATAYFLGLKRTYRIALKLQKRIVSPKRHRIRQFLHRRTRAIFELAVTVHKNIQQRDLEAGRNLGNWFLRLLDRIKPSAEIRSPPGKLPVSSRPPPNSNNSRPSDKPKDRISNHIDENRRLFASLGTNLAPLPAMMMMKMTKEAHHRHFSSDSVQHFCRRGHYDGVIRRDIALWMHQK